LTRKEEKHASAAGPFQLASFSIIHACGHQPRASNTWAREHRLKIATLSSANVVGRYFATLQERGDEPEIAARFSRATSRPVWRNLTHIPR